MAELQSPSNGFNALDWLDRPTSMHGNNGMSYQQPFGTSDATAANNASTNTSPSSNNANNSNSNSNNNNNSVNDRFQGYYTQLPPIITTASTATSSSVQAMANQQQLSHEQQQQQHSETNSQPHNNMLDHNNTTSATNQTDIESRRSSYSASNSTTWMSFGGYPSRDNSTASTMSVDPVGYHQNHGQPTPSPSGSVEKSSQPKRHRTPSTKDIHVEKNTEGKPPYSYATLIKYAIENSQHKKLTLSEIYQWVIEHYPYYSTAGTGWKVNNFFRYLCSRL